MSIKRLQLPGASVSNEVVGLCASDQLMVRPVGKSPAAEARVR